MIFYWVKFFVECKKGGGEIGIEKLNALSGGGKLVYNFLNIYRHVFRFIKVYIAIYILK